MITLDQTVGEIAATSLGAVRVFENNSIDYCCGGQRTLGETCHELGLDVNVIRDELHRVVAEGGSPERDWTQAPLHELIRHIVRTHHEYLKLELPRISDRLAKVLNAHGDKEPERMAELSRVFAGLRAELEFHMHKEEAMLFPVMERFESALKTGQPIPPLPFGSFENPIAVMEREHQNAGNALQQIRQFTNDHQVPEYGCATYRALYDGFRELEADLHLHIHLENNILFPRAVELENSHS